MLVIFDKISHKGDYFGIMYQEKLSFFGLYYKDGQSCCGLYMTTVSSGNRHFFVLERLFEYSIPIFVETYVQTMCFLLSADLSVSCHCSITLQYLRPRPCEQILQQYEAQRNSVSFKRYLIY